MGLLGPLLGGNFSFTPNHFSNNKTTALFVLKIGPTTEGDERERVWNDEMEKPKLMGWISMGFLLFPFHASYFVHFQFRCWVIFLLLVH
jgi:hypothetical protein